MKRNRCFASFKDTINLSSSELSKNNRTTAVYNDVRKNVMQLQTGNPIKANGFKYNTNSIINPTCDISSGYVDAASSYEIRSDIKQGAELLYPQKVSTHKYESWCGILYSVDYLQHGVGNVVQSNALGTNIVIDPSNLLFYNECDLNYENTNKPEQWTRVVDLSFQSSFFARQANDALDLCYIRHKLFVAVGNGSIITSPDNGLSWTSQTILPNLNAITYGEPNGIGLFVAVGNGITYTSPDGLSWTSQNVLPELFSVTYGTPNNVGLFVATGLDAVITSPDGNSWTSQTCPTNLWRSVIYGMSNGIGLFVAVDAPGNVMNSLDGIVWARKTGITGDWQSVAYGTLNDVDLFVACTYNNIMTSINGINWSEQTPAASKNWQSVTYGTPNGIGLFVAVAYDGDGNDIMTSPDGINWTLQSSPIGTSLYAVTYANGLFVAVGSSALTSVDGINWSHHTIPPNSYPYVSITYG